MRGHGLSFLPEPKQIIPKPGCFSLQGPKNSSPLFWVLQKSAKKLKGFLPEDTAPIHQTLKRLAKHTSDLQHARMACQNADLIAREINLTIRLMQHACQRALWVTQDPNHFSPAQLLYEINDILTEYRHLWLSRNRSGGMNDSLYRFNTLRDDYEKHA